MKNKLPPLIIGGLKINIPIIQGGMGVKVSTAALAGAVANCGGAGTIASVGLAYGTNETTKPYAEFSNNALKKEIRQAKKITNGVVGVNIMVALTNYEEMVRTAVKEKVDFIVSGAGLPLTLPEFVKGSSVKLIPIVSSARAAKIIFKSWKTRYNRLPDAVVVEGPMAGGHLGFKMEDLKENKADCLEKLVIDVLNIIKSYARDIPLIAAGGIFDGKDVAKFLKLGAKGVQLGTRFVATVECTVSDRFKQLYLAAGEEDVILIQSPVGMPGRAITTAFIKKIKNGKKIPFKCSYKCLQCCDVKNVLYCMAEALCNATIGNFENAVAFAGSNVARVKKIVPVKELIDAIVNEAVKEFNNIDKKNVYIHD